MSFNAMWLLVLCHVTWCNAMSCDVPCNGRVVCSKWFYDDVVIQNTILYCKVLLCTTKHYSSTYNVLLQYYSVLQSTTPVLLCTAKYYSSTTLYYKVLLQYYSVLQSTTPLLPCTTQYYNVLQYYSVLQNTTPVLQSTTKYYSSTTLYCKVLLQYYSVLQSTTPELLCTTKYYSSTTLYYKVLQRTTPALLCTAKHYSSTTLYYKVLLQYYSVLQSTTPVLLCTTQYNNVLLQYYKILLQYYSVLQSTTPVLLCTAKYYSSTTLYCKVLLQYYSVLQSTNWSASHMKCHLQCAEQQESQSNFTKYCACHAKWISWLILVTYETSFTLRGATSITLQPHQMLPLPRKMMRIIDCRHIWNVIYNARSNRHHPPTSPNTAPATQNCTPKSKKNLPKTAEASIPMRGRFEHDPTMIRPWTRHLAPARSLRLLFALRRRILYWKLQHFALRLSTQISPNTAPATKSDTARSPNTAPATKSDSHDWSSSHIKRHLQCAEQQDSPSNVTKHRACHAKWLSWVMSVAYETSFTMRGATSITLQPHQMLPLPRKMMRIIDCRHIWNVIYNARSNRHHPPTSPNTAPATQNGTPKSKKNLPKTAEASIPMRGRFEHDPTMNSSSRTRPFAEVTFRASETHFVLKITTFRAPAIYPDFTKYCACHEKWHCKITKYCACHEKWDCYWTVTELSCY